MAGSLILEVISPFMARLIDQVVPQQEDPDLKITNIQYGGPAPIVGRSTDLKIYVFNDGLKTANECRVIFTDGIGQNDPKSSRLFSVRPNFDEEPIVITTGIYESVGDYHLDTYVTCENHASSKHYGRTIVISP